MDDDQGVRGGARPGVRSRPPLCAAPVSVRPAAAHELLSSGLGEALAGSPLNLAKLRWLEGQIYAALGKHALAEGALHAAREAFHRQAQGFNGSLVGLDLAALWLEQGRTRDVMDLAQEITEIFARLGVSEEVERAIRYVYVACDMNIATVAKMRYVKRFLERAERDPYLAFVYPESVVGLTHWTSFAVAGSAPAAGGSARRVILDLRLK